MNKEIDIRSLRKASISKASNAAINNNTGKGFWDFLNKDIRLSSGISDNIKESFYLELSSLLEAGVDIRTSLELIRDHQSKNKYRELFNDVLKLVINGATFSSALQGSGKFTIYEYYSVQIGEETGKLIIVLKELAVFFKKKIKQRRQIIGALAYPSIVLVVAFIAVTFMITYVVPMFSDVFKRFGGDLPFATKMIMRLSAAIKEYVGLFLIMLAVLVISAMSQRKKKWFRAFASRLLLRTPIINSILSKIYLSRFANTMALLISSRIPILQAIQMTRRMIGFYPIEVSLFSVEGKILTGMPLYKGLSEHAIYPGKMVAMLKVGEDVNQLDKFFSKISEQYADEVEYQTTLLSKFIEPLIIVFLGLVVGTILVAMYLPLFKLGQGF